jgi:hypothetical protein
MAKAKALWMNDDISFLQLPSAKRTSCGKKVERSEPREIRGNGIKDECNMKHPHCNHLRESNGLSIPYSFRDFREAKGHSHLSL